MVRSLVRSRAKRHKTVSSSMLPGIPCYNDIKMTWLFQSILCACQCWFVMWQCHLRPSKISIGSSWCNREGHAGANRSYQFLHCVHQTIWIRRICLSFLGKGRRALKSVSLIYIVCAPPHSNSRGYETSYLLALTLMLVCHECKCFWLAIDNKSGLVVDSKAASLWVNVCVIISMISKNAETTPFFNVHVLLTSSEQYPSVWKRVTTLPLVAHNRVPLQSHCEPEDLVLVRRWRELEMLC